MYSACNSLTTPTDHPTSAQNLYKIINCTYTLALLHVSAINYHTDVPRLSSMCLYAKKHLVSKYSVQKDKLLQMFVLKRVLRCLLKESAEYLLKLILFFLVTICMILRSSRRLDVHNVNVPLRQPSAFAICHRVYEMFIVKNKVSGYAGLKHTDCKTIYKCTTPHLADPYKETQLRRGLFTESLTQRKCP